MNEKLVRDFRSKLGGGAVFGQFAKSGDAAFVEAAGYAGMDFIILDREHGPIGLEEAQNNIRAAQVAGVLPIVRVPCFDPVSISKALDVGAAGVQIPQITTAEEAMEAVRAVKYHPQGNRGVCRFVRAAHYSAVDREQYFRQANADSLVILQLEGQQAFENLNEILTVSGIDILFIGPYDLSQSLGLPGQTTHPAVVSQMSDIVAQANMSGITTGTFTDTPATLKMWLDAGVRYLAHSVDVGVYYEACSGLVQMFRGYSENSPAQSDNSK